MTKPADDIGTLMASFTKHFDEWSKTTKVGEEIKFPITVNKIEYRMDVPIRMESDGHKSGTLVAVRSVKEKHGDKTRLGILVGFVPLDVSVALKHPEGNQTEGSIMIASRSTNPVIFIPELGESVLGAESWWGQIKDESQLKEITNDDIQNVWYVKALKQLAETKAKKEG